MINMAKRGRKNKYETHVKPYLDNIEKWAQECTEQQIANKLNVGYSSFIRYKNDFRELREALKKGHDELVYDLRSTLIKRAKGFTYEESKVVKEQYALPDELREILLKYGADEELLDKINLVKTEINIKHALPDVAALNLALKNYDKDNWSNDPQMLEIRKKELELREKQLERNEW